LHARREQQFFFNFALSRLQQFIGLAELGLSAFTLRDIKQRSFYCRRFIVLSFRVLRFPKPKQGCRRFAEGGARN